MNTYRAQEHTSPIWVPFVTALGGELPRRGPRIFAEFLGSHASRYRRVSNPFFAMQRVLDFAAADAPTRVRELSKDAEASGTAPIFFGGDHGLTYVSVSSLATPPQQLALVVFDAHSDVQGVERDLRCWNVLRKLKCELGEALHLVHIGFRDQDAQELSQYASCIIAARDLVTRGHQEAATRLHAAVAGRPVYLSIDLDVLDPFCFESVMAPISGGLTPGQLFALIGELSGHHVLAADLVEYAPHHTDTRELVLLADLFWRLEESCAALHRVSR